MNSFKHTDMDYADVLMFGLAIMCAGPAVLLAGYGVYSTLTSISTSIIASLI
mgnify:CR=1 FL=1